MEKLYYGYYKSPIGNLRIVVDESSLVALDFNEDEKKQSDEHRYINEVKKQLDEYFKGTRELFDLNIKMNGTDFQNKVWNELTKIPYGETISYKELATRIGNDKACRAVGNANNKNKISIVIPCHRVVGSNKKLVGYAGGLEKKEWLINHENKVTNE
ncbi:methylated-DNA-[]-cysteine S-methyltransferase family protein [[Clostridium] bifermentans ATCC 638]|uniref:Methylated-DNA--protein-cysteine methyltransferase n=1 Tax=Paraclostridium bifermentans ATCC 638 = DSM 14991 TaxID=1233171 RepID=T4VPK8_PARBF|nr:methylated-DNA--[protein]-cysteine S-methyltransferase [Paraclostridium bifermentans]EQK43070.1 methylated-DNA-[]-cysteine S-methyltransferase family protein [[Clostridium] bifermentans ATCC 638] [Paraclostridium bifermentans ATCC 638 = DSM 14991]RIZ60302.1 cysteine methyltransferase [Paraclostridium bifermentans]UAG16944.1 methylated-DNA--[protein]-cysteine S-methyltransferase [Paraclostridium bifermentans]